jgi:hypothetical protein
MVTTRNPIALVAARVQSDAKAGRYGPDSADVAMVARDAMPLTPLAAARVGAALLRAALEGDATLIADDALGQDLVAIGRCVLDIGQA